MVSFATLPLDPFFYKLTVIFLYVFHDGEGIAYVSRAFFTSSCDRICTDISRVLPVCKSWEIEDGLQSFRTKHACLTDVTKV